jgi:GNAT superfamily N-acetyltransferase
MQPRLLTAADVPAALELSTAAGWNQTAADWERMITLEPEGCFGIDDDGRLAATTTLLCFGDELAWIGMVLTHRDHQRKGLAHRLMCAALDTAQARGVRTIKLDATDQGRPLYLSLGFIDEQPIERWRAELLPRQGAASPPGTALPHGLDCEAFGANRARFVEALGKPAACGEDGYIMTRPGTRANYIGPCVAMTSERAAELFVFVLHGGPWFWDLLPDNRAARDLAAQFGFVRVRELVRMRSGPPIRKRDDLVWAIAGFEAG